MESYMVNGLLLREAKAIYTHDGSIQLFYIQGKRVDKEEWDKLHRS